ncbi:hypothetical protein O6H91_05G083400 [Diphasiastrum complanatum]|uniref:Uncharacterized protein n=2 Tax=Diphasiastrum complanatum TaxID=34168 RepID=A0ACC2DQC2_DIPCM|nr:hypothetical protein O6H91_05G083100 [Diphasiastrum complanatum]KAJ7556431.1 hypothetical protein O6H91_05G083400 [Diphasiastrum complanatum]
MAWRSRCRSIVSSCSSASSSFLQPLSAAAAAAALSRLAASTGAEAYALRFARSVTSANDLDRHTSKWMQSFSRKSPMQLINEVPPIAVEKRIVACDGGENRALGHPVEYICLDLEHPAVCKYCGLRYVQVHH